MKLFEEPKVEVVMFTTEDIITTSDEEMPALFDETCF